jgi:hypothetical protein
VEIVALLTEYIVYESYINETECLNTVLKNYLYFSSSHFVYYIKMLNTRF